MGKIMFNGVDYTAATSASVTGVKGKNETSYRRGNVNITPDNIGLGNVPNVATDDQTPTFTESTSRENIKSGEKVSTIFGKIKKWFSDLKAVAFSGSYNDLSNKPTIGNGTITIKQAGTSKGTFTTNQTGNTTIELTDNNTTYSTGTASSSGLTKLYTGTGTNTDGTMTQSAINSALSGKASTSVATTSANGLMSSSDKTKLNGIATGANKYTLPSSTSSVLGGVKLSDSTTVTNSTGLALPVTEKNPNVSGSLAAQISQLNTDLKSSISDHITSYHHGATVKSVLCPENGIMITPANWITEYGGVLVAFHHNGTELSTESCSIHIFNNGGKAYSVCGDGHFTFSSSGNVVSVSNVEDWTSFIVILDCPFQISIIES